MCLDTMSRKNGEKVGISYCHGLGGNQVRKDSCNIQFYESTIKHKTFQCQIAYNELFRCLLTRSELKLCRMITVWMWLHPADQWTSFDVTEWREIKRGCTMKLYVLNTIHRVNNVTWYLTYSASNCGSWLFNFTDYDHKTHKHRTMFGQTESKRP